MFSKHEKLKYCIGCRDNFYNGNNPYGIKECWLLKSARLKWREIYLRLEDIRPTRIKTLSCFQVDRCQAKK